MCAYTGEAESNECQAHNMGKKGEQENESLGYYVFSTVIMLFCAFILIIRMCVCALLVFSLCFFFLIPSRTLSNSYELITASHCTIVPFIEMVMWSSRNTRRLLKNDSMPSTHGMNNKKKNRQARLLLLFSFVCSLWCAFWSSSCVCELLFN